MKKCCLHPDQVNCKGKIKVAHVLQNNKIIPLLAGVEHHIYMIEIGVAKWRNQITKLNIFAERNQKSENLEIGVPILRNRLFCA